MADPEIITFGCRLNAYESEVMREHVRETGLSNTIIVNTCAVTAEAERQARQAIRRARRNHPDARIIVTGCAAQISPDAYAEKLQRLNQCWSLAEMYQPELQLVIFHMMRSRSFFLKQALKAS